MQLRIWTAALRKRLHVRLTGTSGQLLNPARSMVMIGTQRKTEADPKRSEEELKAIAQLERAAGRKLTEQEIAMSLEQMRAIGEL